MQNLRQQILRKPQLEQELKNGLDIKTQIQAKKVEFQTQREAAVRKIQTLEEAMAKTKTELETLAKNQVDDLQRIRGQAEFKTDAKLNSLAEEIEDINTVLTALRASINKEQMSSLRSSSEF